MSFGVAGTERQLTNVAAGTADTDAVNVAQLTAEAAARAAADTTLQANIDTEAATRLAADTTLQANIDTEAATRLASDTTLQANIDTEALTRAMADVGLQSNIDTEAATRLSVDNAIIAVNLTQDGRLAVHDTRLNAIDVLNLTQSSQIAALQSLTATHTSQIATLFSVTNLDRRDARRGTAAAIAEVPAPFPSEPGKTSYTFNLANFRGQQAMGLSLAHRFGSDTPFALTAGASYAGGRSTAVRVGVAGEF